MVQPHHRRGEDRRSGRNSRSLHDRGRRFLEGVRDRGHRRGSDARGSVERRLLDVGHTRDKGEERGGVLRPSRRQARGEAHQTVRGFVLDSQAREKDSSHPREGKVLVLGGREEGRRPHRVLKEERSRGGVGTPEARLEMQRRVRLAFPACRCRSCPCFR